MFEITLKGKAKMGKTTCGVKALKTQTVLTYKKEEKGPMDMEVIRGDIKTLGLHKVPLVKLVVDFGTAKGTGRIVNRCNTQFKRIGIEGPVLDWHQEGGKVEYELKNMEGADAVVICFLLGGLADRARTKMSYTQHNLTMFDIKQTVGIVWGVKQEEIICVEVDAWMNDKMAIAVAGEMEELKKAKARIKSAKAKSAKTVKLVEAVDEN